MKYAPHVVVGACLVVLLCIAFPSEGYKRCHKLGGQMYLEGCAKLVVVDIPLTAVPLEKK